MADGAKLYRVTPISGEPRRCGDLQVQVVETSDLLFFRLRPTATLGDEELIQQLLSGIAKKTNKLCVLLGHHIEYVELEEAKA